MIDRFESLLQELGEQLGLPLHPDHRGACGLNINNRLHIQIEPEPSQERILIACFICDIPPGKFRENILKDAMRSNHPLPTYGALSYSEKNNKLSLFAYLPLPLLHGEKLASFLMLFIRKAESWKTGVEAGQTSTLVMGTKKEEPSPFGLKP